jgi:hypothetical protein
LTLSTRIHRRTTIPIRTTAMPVLAIASPRVVVPNAQAVILSKLSVPTRWAATRPATNATPTTIMPTTAISGPMVRCLDFAR